MVGPQVDKGFQLCGLADVWIWLWTGSGGATAGSGGATGFMAEGSARWSIGLCDGVKVDE